MKKSIKNILFITWDGPETQYLERLFLPIFAGLEKKDISFMYYNLVGERQKSSNNVHKPAHN